jgi:hypothetical protein
MMEWLQFRHMPLMITQNMAVAVAVGVALGAALSPR